jgi:hypothetical protein
MEQLKHFDSLGLREKTKYDSVPETWKLKPLCCLSDIFEREVYYAVLEGWASAGMAALRSAHTFTLFLINARGEEVLYFKKSAGLFSNKIEVFNDSEDLLGSAQKHGPGAGHFRVTDASNQVLYEITEAFPGSTETFRIRKNGVTLGKISRRPGRVAEEEKKRVPFGITFPLEADTAEKSVLLGALFLIDLSF